MTATLDAPKVFISYSWKPFQNKQRTIELAERLSADGVHVIIDEWDLSEGQDKYQFMEQMVNNEDIKRVLIICNKDYSEKANQKKGGVGVESLIISDEIYRQADQKKFIPVIFEKDETGKEYVPTFVKSRIYIDLSGESTFEEEYEKLLRNIFDKPLSKRPPIGTIPAHIHESDPVFLRTSHKVKAIENALKNERKNYQVFIDDYYQTFLDSLDDFQITDDELKGNVIIDELVLSHIEAIKDLRNDFVEFLNIVLLYSFEFDEEKFHSFLEKLISYLTLDKNQEYPSHTHGYLRMDIYRFFFYELFLYLTTILLEKEKFEILGRILSSSLVIYNERSSNTQAYSYTIFCQPVESLDRYRNQRLNLRRISITADTIKQRADIKDIKFKKLAQADVLLYYRAIMYTNEEVNGFVWHRWWPYLSVYWIHHLPIIDKMMSKRYFDKIKPVFAVDTAQQLSDKVSNVLENKRDDISRFNLDFPYIQKVFNFKKIGTIN